MSADGGTLAGRVAAYRAAVQDLDRPEVWIHRLDDAQVEAAHTASLAGEGPLAGLLVAVKNNVAVAGVPTTAACPAYATGPAATDAPVVARLRAAGGTVVGATNLDQFATGLVGQRSPYGGVRDARRPAYVSGGSSSGSAVAVALGLVDVAVGTDTAGSGRVPAGLQGVVGIKPTLGVVSTEGVVPACRSFDAVTVFARDLDTAATAMGVMGGGPGTRAWPVDVPLAAPPAPRVAVPASLVAMAPGWTEAFERAVARLREAGCTVEPVPFELFLEAARLLYGGGLVAERHAAVGEFVEAHTDAVEPVVGDIIRAAGAVSASDYVRDTARLSQLRSRCLGLLAGHDALLVPTSPGHPTRAAVAQDPVGLNSWLGTYTNFCNLFDLSAVAVPAGTVADEEGEAQFGVTVLARPFHDAVALDVARLVADLPEPVAAAGAAGPAPSADPWPVTAGAAATELVVVGAHLPGQPLAHQLTSRGARWVGPVRTAPAYRLSALPTDPPKPGLSRVGPGGASIEAGAWQLTHAALGSFLAALPTPMTLGAVELDDGRWVTGFGVDAEATGTDITAHGGWLHYLADGRRTT